MSSLAEARSVRFSDVPKGRMVIWLVVAGEIVIFGGGVVCYLLYKFTHPALYDAMASNTNTPMGALNTLVLLTSSFLVVMAHHYSTTKELGKMKLSMIGTILLGATFLVVKSFEWIPKIQAGLGLNNMAAFDIGAGKTFWWFYFFLTGMHAAHVILGMLAILIVMFNVRNGKNLHRVEMSGIYWHFVDLVWIFLFPLFYLSR